MATTLMMTPTVKAMDTQRWVCRIHSFQFIGTSLNTGPNRFGPTYDPGMTDFGHALRPAHGILASRSTSFPLIIVHP